MQENSSRMSLGGGRHWLLDSTVYEYRMHGMLKPRKRQRALEPLREQKPAEQRKGRREVAGGRVMVGAESESERRRKRVRIVSVGRIIVGWGAGGVRLADW
eukprot:GFKZ01001864.1.p3 GENE.GFKZ01001864.1~~GFKZ01001864.1.p3  ORF type:complete len:101 (-),score=11.41 GFKZ01001864.1:348-650(-)